MLKHSRQRDAIKAFLMTRYDHPTADVVYTNLRKEFPNISLGTVYRNLTLLSDLGEIQKLSVGDGVDHFDGNPAPHLHFACTACKGVQDLDLDSSVLKSAVHKASDHLPGRVDGLSVYFYGVCDDCLTRAD